MKFEEFPQGCRLKLRSDTLHLNGEAPSGPQKGFLGLFSCTNPTPEPSRFLLAPCQQQPKKKGRAENRGVSSSNPDLCYKCI